MQNISTLTYILFFAAAAFSIFMFLKATKFNRKIFPIICTWLVIQSALALSGFYTNTSSLPPRLFFALGIPVIGIILLLLNRRGNSFLSQMDLPTMTLLHIVRIPVEFC